MKRKLSLLMALMMVVALLPMSSFAASKSSVATQTVAADSSIRLDLVVEREGAIGFTTGGVFEVVLGDNAAWATNANIEITTQTGSTAPVALSTTNYAARGSKVLEVTVPATAPDRFNIRVNVQLTNAEGEQKVQVRNINANVTNQTLTYAVVSGTGNIVFRALEAPKTITRNAMNASTFEIREIDPDAFTGTTATLTLPRNFTWQAGTTVEKVVGGSTTDVTPALVDFEGKETLTFDITQNPNVVERFIVTPVVRPTRDAKTGKVDVRVRISGTTQFVDIAEYKDYEVVAKVDRVQEIVAGHREDRNNQVRVTLEGTGNNSFLSNREISFKVTNGRVSLRNTVNGGSADEIGIGTNVPDFTDEFFVTPTFVSGVGPSKITLDLNVFGNFNAGGRDLELTIEGAGVEKQTIKLADIVAPATITVDKATDVVLGLQNQIAPEITIVETQGSALREGFYWIDFPSQSVSGITFLTADVEVTSGDIEVDITRDNVNGRLVLEVEGESRVPSTIVIKNIKVSLDRTVAFGPLNARVAYRETWMEAESKVATREIKKDIPFLNVVTEIQGARRLTTVFTLDSVTYTVDGETRTLDAAPFISNNRTMLPIGTVAQLVGATVNYSPSTRTAVFTKDNLVVSMNLDTNILLVNGSPVAMDAKPEIVNSRAFVPVVFVAQAFGIQNNTDIVYDAATRTVTLFPAR